MWSSRDVAIIIVLAVVSFLYTVFVGQLGNLLTGVLGFNYFFFWGHAILIAFGLLIYEGRRWRFLTQGIIVALLTLPTYQSGLPFDITARIPMVANSFLIDILFNSAYGYFKKKNRLLLWIMITNIVWILIIPFLFVINMSIFYSNQALSMWLDIYFMLFPITFIEMVIGAYIGYKLHNRIEMEEITK
ncbi:MAG: hypothetical protein P8X97_04095 [Candidatus Bathyarchaeota archaeon]